MAVWPSEGGLFFQWFGREQLILVTYILARQDMDRFGGAVDSAAGAGLMIVGDEFSEVDGCV